MELSYLLDKLKMEHLELQLDAVCEQAAQRELDYKSFLIQALQVEGRSAISEAWKPACARLASPGQDPEPVRL